MKEIPVITGYKLDGVEVPRFDPLSDLDRVQPVVTLLPGWNKDISGCKSWDALPKAAKQYVEFLESSLVTRSSSFPPVPSAKSSC